MMIDEIIIAFRPDDVLLDDVKERLEKDRLNRLS